MNEYNDYRGQYQANERADWYEKGVYKKGGFDNFLWEIEKIALLSIMKESLPSFENIQALDFACGTGRISEFLESHIDSIDALDISDEMVRIAKTKTKKVKYIVADVINDTDILNKKYDLITNFRFVLFAQPELRKAVFDRLAHALNEEHGRLIVGLHGNPFSRRGLKHIWEKLKGTPKEKQLKSFSLNEMKVLASDTGFEMVAYTGVGFIPRKVFALFGAKICNFVEKSFYKAGFFKYIGSNLIVVFKLKK